MSEDIIGGKCCAATECRSKSACSSDRAVAFDCEALWFKEREVSEVRVVSWWRRYIHVRQVGPVQGERHLGQSRGVEEEEERILFRPLALELRHLSHVR